MGPKKGFISGCMFAHIGKRGAKMANKKTSDDNKTGPKADNATITIKKYANRRLYNTATSSYVTLDDLAQMVRDGVDFSVYNAKSGEDITRSVLTQIIVEEEAKGHNLLPIGFLRDLIGLYGDSLQSLVPGYLDQSMRSFTRNQEQIRSYMEDAIGPIMPIGQLEKMSRKNMAMFENAMKMFSPFQGATHGRNGGGDRSGQYDANGADGTEDETDKTDHRDEILEDLKDKIEAMQKQLNVLGSGKS